MEVRLHSAADASLRAALLVPRILPDILGPRALPAGRLGVLGATPDFHHGLLVTINRSIDAVAPADTLSMPGSVFVFRRGGECIVITRHNFTNCTMLAVIRHDGTTHSRSFANVESAIDYHQQLSSVP